MKKAFFYVMVYMLFWCILAEKTNIEAMAIGLLISTIVFVLNEDSLPNVRRGFTVFGKLPFVIEYIVILLKEVIVSNIQVARIVLSRQISLDSRIVVFEIRLKSNLSKTILANSITLTPGTLTVGMDENRLTVHCLQAEYSEGIIGSKLENILKKIEE